MGAKTSIYLLALAALTLAANVTYVTTPSGKIHITYVDNGTYIVVNINNNKVITANIKLNVTVGGEQYLLHVVGFAKGYFDNATINKLVSLLNQSKSPEVLLSAFKTLVDYNKTKELKVKAMLTPRAINASAPNATYLKMKIEYELERRLSKLNKTLTTEDEWEIKIMTRDLNKTADLLAAIAARLQRYNISDAQTLLYVAQRIKEITPNLKKLELYLNGTAVEIKFNKNTYKIEIEKGNKDGKSDEKREVKKSGRDSQSEENKSNSGKDESNRSKDEKSGGNEKDKKEDKSSGGSGKNGKSDDKDKKGK
ncbi:MAG: hypothetical protein LM562_02195 [Pyrobaculum sp.]|nr:hypothetical protein [Pyrobaculum sp.]